MSPDTKQSEDGRMHGAFFPSFFLAVDGNIAIFAKY